MYNIILSLAAESFDTFRRWFNARFKLVINNHYAGLLRINNSLFVTFLRRLAACLDRDEKGYYFRSNRSFFKFKLGHDTIKVYPF